MLLFMCVKSRARKRAETSGEEWCDGMNGTIDNVNHPPHYEGKTECIDVMVQTQGVEAVMSFCLCNAFKYLFRHKRKNGIEDVRKARWYLDKYLELVDQNNSTQTEGETT